MGNRVQFLVSFELPEHATVREARAYTADAVRSWSGSLQPPGADQGDGTSAKGEAMFNLDPETVRVVAPRW